MMDITQPLVTALAHSFAFDDDLPPFEFLDSATKSTYEGRARDALVAVFDELDAQCFMLADLDENGPRDRFFGVLAEQITAGSVDAG
jgi:hypothetical protein